MALRKVADSTAEPVTLEEAKEHLRVDLSDDDPLIRDALVSAREVVETRTSRIGTDQTWRLTLDDFPTGGVIRLGRSPLSESTGAAVTVEYLRSTAAGTTSFTTFGATNYIVDGESEPPRVVLKDDETWPTDVLANANAVRVEFVAGYGTSSTDVPQRYRSAIKLATADAYEHRESVIVGSIAQTVPGSLNSLIWSLKVPEVP